MQYFWLFSLRPLKSVKKILLLYVVPFPNKFPAFKGIFSEKSCK